MAGGRGYSECGDGWDARQAASKADRDWGRNVHVTSDHVLTWSTGWAVPPSCGAPRMRPKHNICRIGGAAWRGVAGLSLFCWFWVLIPQDLIINAPKVSPDMPTVPVVPPGYA